MSRRLPYPVYCTLLFAVALPFSGLPETAAAQSNQASNASAASLDASVEVPIVAFEALSAGGHFSVTAVQASARGTLLTISVAPAFGSLVLATLVEPKYNLLSGTPKTSVGTVLVVSGGLLLMLGEEVIAFLPEPAARAHIHSRKIAP
ncbi:MAG: hypothetical protein ABI858_01090 [Pseudoxanthomonas sp.]